MKTKIQQQKDYVLALHHELEMTRIEGNPQKLQALAKRLRIARDAMIHTDLQERGII